MLGEKKNNKYFTILEAKKVEMKEKIRKEYLKKHENCLKFNSRNLIKGINTS